MLLWVDIDASCGRTAIGGTRNTERSLDQVGEWLAVALVRAQAAEPRVPLQKREAAGRSRENADCSRTKCHGHPVDRA